MEGALLPLAGLVLSSLLGLICLLVPQLRRFVLAAITTPFLTSVALLVGSFVLADLHPSREYGAAYTPKGTEHDPTTLHYALWIVAVIGTLLLSSWLAYRAQLLIVTMLQNTLAEKRLGIWLEEKRWFGFIP